MTAILDRPTSTLEAAATGRPNWATPKPRVALRTVRLRGRPYTGERWEAIEAGVVDDGSGSFTVVLTRWWTNSGWSGRRRRVLTHGLRPTAEEALALADELLAEGIAG
jgi:hypothetical protein